MQLPLALVTVHHDFGLTVVFQPCIQTYTKYILDARIDYEDKQADQNML